jgi:hypothetical protein
MSNGSKNLKVKVEALARDTESLLKLLGGSPDDRLRFWEILKGITTPAVLHLVEAQVEALDLQVNALNKTVNAVHANAKELSAGR